MDFDRLKTFIEKSMRMSHIYQPVMTLISTVGGAGGPLYGTFFLQVGMKTAGKMELTLVDWTEALEAALSGVIMAEKTADVVSAKLGITTPCVTRETPLLSYRQYYAIPN